jgi:hypothetical protein
LDERVTFGAPFFAVGWGVSVGLGDGVSSGLGVGDPFLCFRGVGLGDGDGVGEIFLCFGEAVGDGLGVAFFAERFRCLRGAGVGVGAKIFLIFVPNDSSAPPGVTIAPKQIVASKRILRIILIGGNNQRASS